MKLSYRPFICGVTLGLSLFCNIRLSAQSHWKAGAASVDITPDEPIWLAGYGSRTRPSEGVLQRIHAKALVLEDETGARTVLVTSDLLGFVKEVSQPIAERVQRKYNISR